MTRLSASIQIAVVLSIVGYSTYQFFLGHFVEGMAFLPLLMLYYVFVTARQRRKDSSDEVE